VLVVSDEVTVPSISADGPRKRVGPVRGGRLRFLLGDRLTPVVALVVVSVFTGLTESAILTLIAQVAAALVDGATRLRLDLGPVHATSTVRSLLFVGLALAVGRLALVVPLSILPAQIAADVQQRLRLALFSAFTRASWETQSRDREGQLQELIGNQVGQATGGALNATQLLTAVVTVGVLMISALVLNAVAALFVLVTAVLLFILLRPFNELGVRRARALSQAQLNVAHGISEATRVAEETHVFGVDGAQRTRMDGLLGAMRALFYRTQMLANFVPNVYRSLVYVVVLAGLGVLTLVHASHVAALGAVVLLLVRAAGYGQAAQGSYAVVRQALPFVERLQEAVVRYSASTPARVDRRLGEVQSVSFDDVSFAYATGRPVLSEITFAVAKGEAIGIVGPSGAGKSTLVQLLLRLRTADAGRYLVNGIPAEDVADVDWHSRVAYVPQESRLLHTSVRDNIRYYRAIDDAEVERAARLARVHEDIVTWANGYDTIVGPRADAVSGGQQQRICIARALCGRPEILILDEPTSALDPRSESLLQESLQGLKATLTLFVVAHRISTLNICTRIMVIEHGKIAAFDTAENLRLRSAYFRSAAALATGTRQP
jgi:ATP-binding cassette subfamily B protein